MLSMIGIIEGEICGLIEGTEIEHRCSAPKHWQEERGGEAAVGKRMRQFEAPFRL